MERALKFQMQSRFGPLASLALVTTVIATLLYLWQSQLVAPEKPGDSGFDQARAAAILGDLLQEGTPHPVGSPENARVRDRIVGRLVALGYTPEVQTDVHCDSEGKAAIGCARVSNVVAVRRGTGSGKAVLVSAHYDSVGAGPGAGDDGSGVAIVLEAARVFATRTIRNDLAFLFTDGEEAGLWGARAFAARHPLMKHIGAVVNLEARGASGASMMFETGSDNRQLMKLYSRAVARPVSNSLAYEVYRRMPNDTDFSVYREQGIKGFNFAFSAAASLYHSASDSPANLDRRSLQHQGDNAFEVLAALAGTELTELEATGDASYFDVFGRQLLIWPASWNLPLAVLSLLGMIGLVVAHRGAFSFSATGWAISAVVATSLLLYAMGWLLSYPLGKWPGTHGLDHPWPWPGRASLAGALILVPLVVSMAVGQRAGTRPVLLITWTFLAVVSCVATFLASGASYPFLWPALVATAVGVFETARSRKSLFVMTIAGFLVSVFFFVGFLLALELVIGFAASEFKLLAMLPLTLALLPVFTHALSGSRRAWPALASCATACFLATLMASLAPAYSRERPRGVSLVYYDEGTQPRWLVETRGPPDEEYLGANGFPAADQDYLQGGVAQASGRFKPAKDLDLAGPALMLGERSTSDGVTTIQAILRDSRGGVVGFVVPPASGIQAIRSEGQYAFRSRQPGRQSPAFVRFLGFQGRPVPVEISFDAATNPTLVVYERSALPDSEEARALKQSRPADSAPVQAGDSALLLSRIALGGTP